jgi:hypothetical protein
MKDIKEYENLSHWLSSVKRGTSITTQEALYLCLKTANNNKDIAKGIFKSSVVNGDIEIQSRTYVVKK